MSTEPLFDDTPLRAALAPENGRPPESADRRRTRRQRYWLARRRHPLTAEPLRQDAPDVADRAGPGPRCRSCRWRCRVNGGNRDYWKCGVLDGALITRSAASDLRLWWPACGMYRPEDQ